MTDRAVNVRLAVEVQQFVTGMRTAAAASNETAAAIEAGSAKSVVANKKNAAAATTLTGTFKQNASFAKSMAGTLAGLAVVKFGKDAINAAREQRKAIADTQAVLKSTGGAANVTAQDIQDLASAQSKLTGVDDEVIQGAENVMLTFKGVQNQAGKNNDIFNQSIVLSQDLAARMKTDVSGAALQLGKALNDPEKGLARLQRVGVMFTEQQKSQVKALMATGDVMGAQKVILGELKDEFGGSAKAMADPADKARVAWHEFEETVGNGLLPVVDSAATMFANDLLPAITAVGEAVSPLVHLVGDLPAPLKEALALFAAWRLAAVALRGTKISGFFSDLGTSVSSSVTDLRAGETAAIRTGRALGTMAKIGAGAGGLALLSQGVQHASSDLGKLESIAGGAMLGLASGSPWGIALGAGAGLLAAFASSSSKAAEAQQMLDSVAKSVTSTLDAQGNATKATASNLFGQLQDQHLDQVAEKLGANMGTVAEATTNSADAWADLEQQVGVTRKQLEGKSFFDMTDEEKSAALLFGSITNLNGALKQSKSDLDRSKSAGKGLNDALHGTSKSAKDAAGELKKLQGELDNTADKFLEQRGDMRGYRAAVRDAAQSTKELVGHWKDGSAKADDIDEKLDNIASTGRKVADSMVSGSKRQSDYLNRVRNDILKQANAYKVPEGALRGYLHTLGLTPKQIDTLVRLRGDLEAKRRIQALANGTYNAWVNVYIKQHGGIPGGAGASRNWTGATGGQVDGPGTETSDSIPAFLSKNEFVVRASQAKKHLALLHQINTPGFASGGEVRSAIRGFNINGLSQDRGEVRDELHQLLLEMRKAFGADSRIVKSTDRLGDKLLDLAGRQDKLQASLEKATQARRDLAQSAAQSFNHDIFGGGFRQGIIQLHADSNDSKKMIRRLRRAKHLGINGPALAALAASGDLAFIDEIDTKREARLFQHAFSGRAASQQQLGQFAGNAVYGHEIHHLRHSINRLNRHMDHVERRIESGAYKGTRDGFRDHNKAAARNRR